MVEAKIQKAFEREEELQNYMVYYVIDEANSISVGCPPHRPDKEGKGCFLNFALELPAGGSLRVQKKLLIKGKAKEVEEGLKKVDPNKTQEHQHFGSIFEAQDTYASHYFCQPEGLENQKNWGCYLYIDESLN